MNTQTRRHSFFWPVILIGAGIIFLLRNIGILQTFDLNVLLRLWPLILVVIGLDLIFGHRYPWMGALIGLITIGAAAAFLYYAPSLGFSTPTGVKTEVLSSPLGNTQRVTYNVDTSYAPVKVSALSSSTDLIYATIVHNGQLNFSVAGEAEKTVSLSETNTTDSWFSLDLGLNGLKWDIGLNPAVPTALNLNGGSGSLDIDLSGMKLDSFRAHFGSGASKITLPVSQVAYQAEIESGSGSVSLALPASTSLTLSTDSGSGSLNISLPKDSTVKVEIMDGGSGSVSLPAGLTLVSGNGSFENDTWQSSGFAAAANTITIKIVSRGSGSIHISQ